MYKLMPKKYPRIPARMAIWKWMEAQKMQATGCATYRKIFELKADAQDENHNEKVQNEQSVNGGEDGFAD